MDKQSVRWLNNVPYVGKNADQELANTIAATPYFTTLSAKEKQRLDYEMNIIKETGTAKVFLFGRELLNNGSLGTTLQNEGCSFVNYLLGLSKVNPVLYDLPFVKFLNKQSTRPPKYCIYALNGGKAKILNHLYEKFGKSLFFKSKTHGAIYLVSSKPVENKMIQKCVSNTGSRGSYEENISFMTYKELVNSGFYEFGIIDSISDIRSSDTAVFTEEEILQKGKELMWGKKILVPEFTEIEEVAEFLKDTEYKLLYNEQFILLCNRLLGLDYETAELYQRRIKNKEHENLLEMENLINKRDPGEGEKLFQYLKQAGCRMVSKSHLVARLYSDIEWLNE